VCRAPTAARKLLHLDYPAYKRLNHRLSPHVELVCMNEPFSSHRHANDASRLLLLVIHGGPHSTSLNIFTPALAAFAVAGYEIAAVNYTGSLGFGQRWVEELVGKCGELDVADCWAVVKAWKATLKPDQTGKV
jgi:hypothetical protein